VEFFQETLGKEAQSIIDNLKKIQDHLGNLHDAVVICELLRTFLKNLPKQQYLLPVYQQRDNSGIMVYLSHSYAERQLLIAQFPERWKWFMREEFRKNLASAISIL
jgi:CHAD domain-containing protein